MAINSLFFSQFSPSLYNLPSQTVVVCLRTCPDCIYCDPPRRSGWKFYSPVAQ